MHTCIDDGPDAPARRLTGRCACVCVVCLCLCREPRHARWPADQHARANGGNQTYLYQPMEGGGWGCMGWGVVLFAPTRGAYPWWA